MAEVFSTVGHTFNYTNSADNYASNASRSSTRSNSLRSRPRQGSSSSICSCNDNLTPLPPYRSLLTPGLKYDYQLHKTVESGSEDYFSYHRHPHSHHNSHVHTKNCQHGRKASQKIKIKYHSLLVDTKKKLFNSDLFSLSSSANIKTFSPAPKLTFQSLPLEIVQLVMWQLRDDQRSLVNCIYVSRQMYRATLPVLYHNPHFTTTYRVGQFVTSLQINKHLGAHVKYLDLSKLQPGLDMDKNEIDRHDQEILDAIFNTDPDQLDDFLDSHDRKSRRDYEEGDMPLAGWRDWKYRDSPLYGRRTSVAKSTALSREQTNSTLVSDGSFKYQNRSRSDSDATLARPSGEYENTLEPLMSTSSTLASSSLSIFTNKTKKTSRFKKFRRNLLGSKKKSSADSQLVEKKEQEAVTIDLKAAPRKPFYEPFKEPHPPTNRFLHKYALTKDLPVGYIVHLLTVCVNLKEVNMSNLSISPDYRVLPERLQLLSTLESNSLGDDELYKRELESYKILSLIKKGEDEEAAVLRRIFAPTYPVRELKLYSRLELATEHVFMSDLAVNSVAPPKEVDQLDIIVSYKDGFMPIYVVGKRPPKAKRTADDRKFDSLKLFPSDIVERLLRLSSLESINLQNAIWMDRKLILQFLDHFHSRKDLKINFVDTGMLKDSLWCIEGDVHGLARVFKNERRIQRNWEEMNALVRRIGENY